jgi:WD40 repeat protein
MVRRLAWSHDGRRLATVSYDHTARIWDANSGTDMQRLNGHSGFLWSLSWSPNGQYLATAGQDETARVWPTSVAETTGC